MSLSKSYWGDKIWRTMYIIAYTYPESPSSDHTHNLDIFYHLLGELLPCDDCKTHYRNFLKESPITLTSKDSLLSWVNDLENSINKSIGRENVPLERRLKELNDNNPSLKVNNVIPISYPLRGLQGGYSVKRSANTTQTQHETSIPPVRRGVSFGMRKSNTKKIPKGACAGCH